MQGVFENGRIKGTVSRDFRLFYHKSVSPKHLSVPLRPFQIFSNICADIRDSRRTTGVVDTGGKWKKSSIRKTLIILFGHLWAVELTSKLLTFRITLFKTLIELAL
jgi:hypothetical protein